MRGVEHLLRSGLDAPGRRVEVDVGESDGQLPLTLAMNEKIEKLGKMGNKRRTMKC